MAKILLVSHYARSLINFRGEMIKAFAELGHEVTSLGPEKGFSGELKKLGANYREIPLDRTGLNPLKDMVTFFALVRIMRKLKPDIVFSYAIKPVIYGSLAALVAGVPWVYSMITGLGFVFVEKERKNFLQRFVRFLYRLSLKNNAAVFFQNPDDLELFRRAGLLGKDTKAVLINGSGVDLERFYYVRPEIKPLSFLLMARLIWDKGIGEYVEAARRLKKRYPEVSFKLLGPLDSNPSAIKERDIKRWGEEGIIEYLGATDDVRPYLAGCSVYVLPSFREGTPRSVLEAMAMGRPIITSDAPGCRETVIHGVNGFLVPVKDSASLAEAMEKFILNPKLVFAMGEKSRQMAEEKYDVHKVNRTILQAMGLIE